jgi:para-aminobenzoate synthetase component I
VLELYSADGAFETLEAYLADELRDGWVADVFLAYGLSEPLRRAPWAAPPEPCRLPLLAARTRPLRDDSSLSGVGGSHLGVGEWEPSWTPAQYGAAVEEVRAAIARGDVYQVNLVQHLSAPCAGSASALAAALAPLRPLHPRPLEGDGWAIVSASPELFLARRGDRLVTMPIKGTRPLGEDVDDAKDAAEHVMIVDLERNDLSRVCVPGTVHWPELMRQQELAGVTHLVSTVEGRLRTGARLAEILHATFPGGSITGAPKLAAIDQIARLEPVGRGASMGAIGRVWASGDFELALTIRTFAIADGRIHLWVGGGIVWDSEPEAEIEESWVKARPLLAAVGGLVPA